ncbi:MAG: alcohol dehydrogenase catalytic domain-containing protein [Deferribacterota bacterium]|nr:alcohol dehydrogenase catalytic domain-containing protein [Deferribacterota bacterium]
MKAVCINAPEHIVLKDIEKPDITKNNILIRVKAVGICGSDIAAFAGKNPLVTYPRVIGHEIAGEVIKVPGDINSFAIGDRVVIEPYIYCGACYPCSLERFNCCENLKVLGVHVDGGLCEYIAHPSHLLHKVEKNVDWYLLALVEPLSIAVHAVHRSKLRKGEHIVITGCGPIGLLIALYANLIGGIPIVIDPLQKRLNLAKSLGIQYVLNPNSDNVYNNIKDITKGVMAPVLIEASGDSSAISLSLQYASNAGRIVFVGWPKSDVPLKTSLITKKEVDLMGSRNSCKNFPECIDIVLNRKINIEGIISKVIDFEKVPMII